MEQEQAILSFAAFAQSTRLGVFRLLVKHEPEGLAAGEIAKALAVPQNTMSAHLAVLARAGLVISERRSRSIIYRADLATLAKADFIHGRGLLRRTRGDLRAGRVLQARARQARKAYGVRERTS